MRRNMVDCPRIFCVNWFRKNAQGRFLWPGFGENMRILEWIVKRAHGRAYAVETPLGWMPRWEDIDSDGLLLAPENYAALQAVPNDEFKSEILSQEELFLKLAGDLPKEIIFQRELLISRL
jgi:phosphoenolpyruvate carboxykinase (GTP)